MKFALLIMVVVILATACQPSQPQGELPTLAVLASVTPSEAPTATATASDTPLPTNTYTPGPTNTPTPSRTPIPSATFDPTRAAVGTATEAIAQVPTVVTLTPNSSGQSAQTTPQALADVVITERQFQSEVNKQIESLDNIQNANIDFVPGGINVRLTALGGQAFTTGNVFVSIQLTGSFATITVGDITVNAAEPPEQFVEIVNTDFFFMMIDSLDAILTERLGEGHNLESIVITDDTMDIELLVPEG